MIRDHDTCGHFRVEREIARGERSIVYEATDERLHRTVALKITPEFAVPAGNDDRLDRVIIEAARLEHPAICALHEAGIDRGRRFVAMQLVRGPTLADLLAATRERAMESSGRRFIDLPGPPGSDPTRSVLALFRRLAEAVHAAHQMEAVHGHLEPRNVIVRPEGEPVMLNFGASGDAELVRIPSAYAAPEQIEAEGDPIDRRADVYALGAMLVECLTLRPAFEAPTTAELRRRILHTDPSLDDLGRTAPSRPFVVSWRRPLHDDEGDLRAIVETAMAKEPDCRYQTAAELADELQRVLDDEPIRARRIGTLARLGRRVRQRPGITAAVVLLTLTVATAFAVTARSLVELRSTEREVSRRRDLEQLHTLQAELDEERWPTRAAGIASMDAWLARAVTLADRLTNHALDMESHTHSFAVSVTGLPGTDDGTGLEQPGRQHALAACARGAAWLEHSIVAVRQRRLEAETIEARTIDHHAEEWAAALDALSDPDALPVYGGLQIRPQAGLVPLGVDPSTGLLEFGHPQTGAIPVRDPCGRLEFDEASGLVFVLLPGGSVSLGDTTVRLDPFFISKYEMTQAQWQRVTGSNPSGFTSDNPLVHKLGDPESVHRKFRRWSRPALHPVDGVTWFDADRVLARLGLVLPTQTQWQYAARAGTTTPWWTGSEWASLESAENIGEVHYGLGVDGDGRWQIVEFDLYTAPVGSYRHNAFGLYDVLGNVSELARDVSGIADTPLRDGDGLLMVDPGAYRIQCGGDWRSSADASRVDACTAVPIDVSWGAGVRPARPLERF